MNATTMKKIFLTLFSVICLLSCLQQSTESKDNGSIEVSFQTSDSITIYGDLHIRDENATTILLLHQGRSNGRGEYGPIIPELIREGYNILAIDQRRGGQLYGQHNRTITSFSLNDFTYCEAIQDLEAAFTLLKNKGFGEKVILWGSSYSASLAIQLAHQKPNMIKAVLAFSPASGGPMQACRPDDFFATLQTPLLLLRPPSEMEIPSVNSQMELASAHGHQTYVAKNGIHGSSMLVRERVKADVKPNWVVVKEFINKHQ